MAMTDERSTERATERALSERSKAVDAAMMTIEKQFGRGAIMSWARAEAGRQRDPDGLAGARPGPRHSGGIPRGRITRDLRARVVG